jgi:hypothetical protein
VAAVGGQRGLDGGLIRRRKQVNWLDAGADELLASLRVLNGFDIDLATDATRLASRLRDALTSSSRALERAVGERLHHAGVRDLLVKYPTLTALRAVSQSRTERTVKARSPPMPAWHQSPASGTSLAGESRSRRGNHRLKNAMFLAAFASLRDPRPKRTTTGNEPKANATTPP